MNEAPAKILTIDDDALLCETICGYLEEKDYACINAQSGPQGLKLLRSERPDMVLLDIKMPKVSGVQVLEEIVAEFPETPVVIISSTNDLTDVVQVLRLGAWDYLIKPIRDMEFLLHTVERGLDRARLIEENRRYREHLEEEVRRRTAQYEEASRSLAQANVALERKNIALEEVLSNLQREKQKLGSQIAAKAEKSLLPLLHTFKRGLSEKQATRFEQIEVGLRGLTAPFIDDLGRSFTNLTPTELRIRGHIRRGLASKDIADTEGISSGTVNRHRDNIRGKLGLRNTPTNLATFLQKFTPDPADP